MIADFLSPDNPLWRQALAKLPHDIYHTPEYVIHAARFDGGTPFAFYARDGADVCLIPLLVRPIPVELGAPSGWYDAVSPYGYPAPIMSHGWNSGVATRFMGAFQREAVSRSIVSTFLRWHPLLPLPENPCIPGEQLVQEGHTVYIDLTLSEEELAKHVRRDHRCGINRLQREGFRATMNDWRLFPRYMELYQQTMHRLAASPYYCFSKEYFEDLRSLLGDQLHLGCVISPMGDVATASLFTETSGIVQFHLSGTAVEYRREAPSKLLLWFARDWSKQRGNRWMHLGGGVSAQEDGLFAFKAGFSRLHAPFRTSRIIFDSSKYATLAAHARTLQQGSGDDRSNFFPCYRRRFVRLQSSTVSRRWEGPDGPIENCLTEVG